MQVEEKNRQLNEDAETIEEKNELQTAKKKHRKNNFALKRKLRRYPDFPEKWEQQK